jgi:DNA-binding response OmpR family regulator
MPSPSPTDALTSPPHTRLKVLLVEDAPEIRKRLVSLIAEVPGMDVLWAAESVAEAREALRTLRPDIALVDLRLPDGSGLDLVREIRASQMDSFVAVLTAYGGAQVREACLATGADAFLSKNDGLAGLTDMLRAFVEGAS